MSSRRRALVMGLGRFGGGVGTTRFLCREGWQVTVTDSASAEDLRDSLEALAGLEFDLALGGHRPEDFEQADWVVANPAVPRDHPLLARARQCGARVTSEAELFLERVRGPVALVTGTQGKSSTAHFAAQLLRRAGDRVHLGGNIGASLLDLLAHSAEGDAWIVELSSYQLDALSAPTGDRPAHGCASAVAITNVLADHLERHGSRSAYAAAKRRILECAAPDAPALLPGELAETDEWLAGRERRVAHWAAEDSERCGSEGLTIRNGSFVWGNEVLGKVDDLRVPGAFQGRNALVALGLARALGASPKVLAAGVPELKGLPHRLEDLGIHGGHRIWDNAVSTTPDSTLAALQSVDGPLTLLCGGSAKQLDYDALADCAARRARRVVTFGRDGAKLAGVFLAAGCDVSSFDDLSVAVNAAFSEMEPEETLLFSPACASFDAYANFEERARDFRAALGSQANNHEAVR